MPQIQDALTAARDTARIRVSAWARAADRRLPHHLSSLLRRVADRRLLSTASSLAFYGLVSAMPLLMIASAVVQGVVGEDVLRRVIEEAAGNAPEGSGRVLEQLAAEGGALTWTTVLFSAWPATTYGGGLRRALVRASGEEAALPGLKGRLIGLGLVLALPVLTLGGVPLLLVATTLSGGGLVPTLAAGGTALGAAILLATAATTLIYKAFSPAWLGWGETLRAAGLTAVCTAVFSVLFVAYLNIGEVEERFGGGTIAVVVLLGVWLFVANLLLLAGYEAALTLREDDG